jgi:CMP-2-keto-3-deoxyoctulosonic acid synthetase
VRAYLGLVVHIHNKEPIMQNLYIVRTATVASLTAAFVAFGWMSMQDDDLQIAPEQIVVSGMQAEPAMFFHSGIVPHTNDAEPEVYEYY